MTERLRLGSTSEKDGPRRWMRRSLSLYLRDNGSNVAAEFLMGCSLQHREKWLRPRKAQAARRKVRAIRVMMQRDTKHICIYDKAEWDASRMGRTPNGAGAAHVQARQAWCSDGGSAFLGEGRWDLFL
jgi:hypothetical protein